MVERMVLSTYRKEIRFDYQITLKRLRACRVLYNYV